LLGQRLKDLVMSDIYMRHIWGVPRTMSAEQVRDHVAQSVDIFLRAFSIPGD
jgi:hypothetical protein